MASLRPDRAAIERVYYNHRLGGKPPFEQVLPLAALDHLIRQDLRKEAALKTAYGVAVSPAMLDAEVQRINTTTRAPEMLAEIKAALGNDPARFANNFAKPVLVESLLREKFDNDEALHAPQRRHAEAMRAQLLAVRGAQGQEPLTNDLAAARLALLKQAHPGDVAEMTWQLSARPAETHAPADEIELRKHFGQNARILASPPAPDGNDRKLYFQELSFDLQNVLRLQLRGPGDVSAVIEVSAGFLLYLTTEKTTGTLSVAALFIPKRSYDQWLSELKVAEL